MYTLKNISKIIDSETVGTHSFEENWQLVIDSRTLTYPDASLFFAIQTDFNNGHDFIEELIEKGVKAFVVQKDEPIKYNPDCTYLLVDNVIKALQKLAKYHRSNFKIPIIGITGSNGKTIVKEFLNQVLNNTEKTCFSPKSFNSQIGVPLSIWQLTNEHILGVFEAGISKKGEMDNLEAIIHPEIGVLTHIGPAHNQGFASPTEKIIEKLKLFKHSKIVLLKQDENILKYLENEHETFGFNDVKATLNIQIEKRELTHTKLNANYKGENYSVNLPFTDDASIENSCLTWLITLYLKQFNSEKFNRLHAVSMRMEVKQGLHNCLLINDSYSNDLSALSTSLSFLNQQAIHSDKTLIVSDIEESGLSSEELYSGFQQMIIENGVNKLIAIGPEIKSITEHLTGAQIYHFATTELFLKNDIISEFENESILIKGARKFKFERITKKLSLETHGTTLEIDLSATLKNLSIIKSKLPSEVKMMGMVKAFAYGTGTYEVAKSIQNKIDYLAVAYTDEGVALRLHGINSPIMVMNAEIDTFSQLIEHDLEPSIFNKNQLRAFNKLIENQKSTSKKYKIHIELDTGMHRLGFMDNEIDALIEQIKPYKNIQIASIYSHLSASDEAIHDEFTKNQFDTFKSFSKRIEDGIGYTCIKHISNTAGILRFKQDGLDMVRLGIGLYGIDPTLSFRELLEPVFTLKTSISQIKVINSNESIGYSRKSISKEERKIAVLALGYADGLNRILSNGNGQFLIHDQLAPIIGNICMDMCMVDITHIECREGDEAILFGKNKPLRELANQMGTIPYEVLTSISQRVKRIYVSE